MKRMERALPGNPCRVSWLACCLIPVSIFLSGCQGAGQEHIVATADSIRAKYDSAIAALDPESKRHYAVRLYRMTGEDKYRQPVADNLLQTIERLHSDLTGAHDVEYRTARSFELLNEFSETSRKGRLRRALFGRRLDMLFALDILTNAKRVSEHLSPGPRLDSLTVEWDEYLQKVNWEPFLLDNAVIRVFAPQAVNYVYYLNALGIRDLRREFELSFRSVFADERDQELSQTEFRDKIYGLTHFIIAASDYYQMTVDSTRFAWILDYCREHIDRILAETTPDIIAEVGLCFLLTNQLQDPALKRCQDYVRSLYDEAHHMILSPTGSSDLSLGEHRNVLAIMVLHWPDTLSVGPILTALESD